MTKNTLVSKKAWRVPFKGVPQFLRESYQLLALLDQ